MKERNIGQIKNAIYKRRIAQREVNRNERLNSKRNNILRDKFIIINKTAHETANQVNAELNYGTYTIHVLYAHHKPRLTVSIIDKASTKPGTPLAYLTFTAFLLNTITVSVSTTYKSTMSRKLIMKAGDLETRIEDYIVMFYSEFIAKY